MMKRGIFVLEYVKEEHLNPNLTEAVEQFKKQYPVLNKFEDRIPSPSQFYYGKEVWEEAICAILSGKNILLAGHKATGKNIFAENLAAVFSRPRWDISFHVNTDASTLIEMCIRDSFLGDLQFLRKAGTPLRIFPHVQI